MIELVYIKLEVKAMTKKLYYEDSYIKEFDAVVLSCETLDDGKYAIVTDSTAFFPEGGGQPSDIGVLGEANITYAYEDGDNVVHVSDKAIEVGITVHGCIDFERRFRLMQNHSGEHILSGIVNRKYGYDNVGFHMGVTDLTIDYNSFLSREELREVEREANLAVCRNLKITATVPTPEELSKISYRSKKERSGDVRRVEIEDYDRCACCAPHLNRTGEIGIIKVLDSIKYKGGVRVHFKWGFDALDDYNRKYDAVKEISNALSVKQDGVADGFFKNEESFAECRAKLSALRTENLNLKAATVEPTDENVCLFEPDLEGDYLRRFALSVSEKCKGITAVFSGKDGDYSYVIVSRNIDLKANSKEINAAISGRGGGSSEMIQGKAATTRAVAEDFILNYGKCN